MLFGSHIFVINILPRSHQFLEKGLTRKIFVGQKYQKDH